MIDLDAEMVWAEAQDLAEDLAEAGADKPRAALAVAAFLDAIMPLDVLVPGPAGLALEAVDGAAFQRVILALVGAFERDPERRAERKTQRAARRASRVAKRSKKRSIE